MALADEVNPGTEGEEAAAISNMAEEEVVSFGAYAASLKPDTIPET